MLSGILRFWVLLIVSTALIGVNIVQLSCICCDSTYLQVELLPQEKTCRCGSEEPCQGKTCCPQDQENFRHDFYQVAGFSQIVKSALPDIVFFYPGVRVLDCLIYVSDIEDHYFLRPETIPDIQPSPELLCTYRC